MWKPCNSTQKEITMWLKWKEHEFGTNEIDNRKYNMEKWLQKYMYTNFHDVFFEEFQNILTYSIQ